MTNNILTGNRLKLYASDESYREVECDYHTDKAIRLDGKWYPRSALAQVNDGWRVKDWFNKQGGK